MPTQAETTSTLALAEAARQAQVRLRRELVSDVSKVWRVLDFERLQQTWPAWLQVMTATLTRYHSQSADDAALFYRATRQLEVGDPGTAKLADPPSEEWVARALGYAAPGTYSRQIEAKASPQQAERSALTQTLGTSSRIVLDGTRTTVQESAHSDPLPEPVGWYFKTDSDPCYLCALIASRGVVFAGDSFELSNARFIGKGKAKVHNGCACILAPAFSRSMTLPDINQQALDAYKNRGPGDALNAFRRGWEDRNRPAGFKPRKPR